MQRQYRQGDVLVCAVDAIPSSAKPVSATGDRVVVAEGELTGHAHAFAASEVALYRDAASGRAFLIVGKDGAWLRHEEHAPIRVPEGHYALVQQWEYAPRAASRVRD